jgi:signal peptidase I
MADIDLRDLRRFIAAIGGKCTTRTNYGVCERAYFVKGDLMVYADYTLRGNSGVIPEPPIIGQARAPGVRSQYGLFPEQRKEICTHFSAEIAGCRASVGWNKNLDGAPANEHVIEVLPIVGKWAVGEVELHDKWGFAEFASYLVHDGYFTSLKRLKY